MLLLNPSNHAQIKDEFEPIPLAVRLEHGNKVKDKQEGKEFFVHFVQIKCLIISLVINPSRTNVLTQARLSVGLTRIL